MSALCLASANNNSAVMNTCRKLDIVERFPFKYTSTCVYESSVLTSAVLILSIDHYKTYYVIRNMYLRETKEN